MPSVSLQTWMTDRLKLLDDIEHAHRSVQGSGIGARAAALQINQAYAVLLSGQFQGFCRDLHTECALFHLAPISDPDLRQMLLINLVLGRKIDRGNPNPGNIGADFNRFHIPFWQLIDAHRSQNSLHRLALEELNEWRNAIAHQDFSAGMLRLGRPHLTLGVVQAWRKACDGLARSFDAIMKANIQRVSKLIPW